MLSKETFELVGDDYEVTIPNEGQQEKKEISYTNNIGTQHSMHDQGTERLQHEEHQHVEIGDPIDQNSKYDLIVIGAGVAGLYTLYKLYTNRPEYMQVGRFVNC